MGEQDVTPPTQPRVFFRGSDHALPGARLCWGHLASHSPLSAHILFPLL